jgi:RNA polymerase sigma-70 factor, ECF subfamily
VIYRMLRRGGLQDADALEVHQEVLLAVSRSIHRWQPGGEHGSFRGWLRKVTRNLVVSWVRRRRSDGSLRSGLDSWILAEVPDDAAESREFDLEVRRALFQRAAAEVQQEVSRSTWLAFWKVAVDGHSPADVARELGMSEGTVRVAKCRVLARMRHYVRKSEEES